jgi:DHA1 family multidrug resistance protein-like MFS transporter
MEQNRTGADQVAREPDSSPHTSLPEPDIEKRRPRRRRQSSSTSESDSSYDSDDSKVNHHDGHRPHPREIRKSISRTRSQRPQSRPGEARSSAIPQSISRTISRRETVVSRIRTRPNIPPFDHPLSHTPTTAEVIVDFEGPDDPYRPINWPTKKKVITTLLYGLTTMTATWASSAYSAGTRQIVQEFHVGVQTANLGTTLFLFGFGVGPLLWAPLSEVYGRRIAVLTPMFVAMCFSFGSATSKDFQTLMLTRFFGAFFASAPVTNTGGVLGDLYSPAWRGIAIAGYAMAVVGGPCLGRISTQREGVCPY